MTSAEAIAVLKNDSCYECTWGCMSPVECDCPECPVKDAVEVAISALEQNRWIACDECLPVGRETVIVAVKERNGSSWRYDTDVAISSGDYIGGYWDTFNDWDEGQEVHVTHWMPLPEPPKEET